MKAYIARDADGKVYLYKPKPAKGIIQWASEWYFPIDDLPEDVNPQWEDNEPIKVNIKIEKL